MKEKISILDLIKMVVWVKVLILDLIRKIVLMSSLIVMGIIWAVRKNWELMVI